MSRSPLGRLFQRLSTLLALCLALAWGFAGTAAASPLNMVAGNSVEIPAGGSGYLQLRGISMQPGTAVPPDSLTLAAQQLQADDKTRTALYYGIDWGYADTAPDQVALAVWWTLDGNWQSPDHTLAARIGDAAVNAQGIPSWNPQGRNLLTAITQGQASISELTLSAVEQSTWVGSGTLAIQNTSGSDITVYLPYGTLFSSASGPVLVWATGTGGEPGQGTPTLQPVASPTSQPTAPAQATNTPAATATTVPAGTLVPPVPKGPPAQEPTDTPAPPAPKAPPATPPAASPTDTPVPAAATDTPQPTDSPEATDTPHPTNTPIPATATPTVQSGGSGSEGSSQPPSAPDNQVQPRGVGQLTGNQAGLAQPARPPQSVPLASQGAPLPPTAGASPSATTAVPPPAATGASQAAPGPVSTEEGGTGLPQPVNTAAAQATVPFPVVTVYPTAVPSTPLPTKAAPGQSPTAPAQDTGAATAAAVPQKPTPAPTAAPPPSNDSGGAGSATKPTEPPVIVVGPSNSTPAATQNGGSASGSGQNTPPKVNPVTGAGPSMMPLWLSGTALLMLLGGLALRRVGRASAATLSVRDLRK